MFPKVTLNMVGREDVQRMAEWLTDREVNSAWYGLDDSGPTAAHRLQPR